MKKYTITVNGTAYDVTVEENGSAAQSAAPAAPAAPAAAPAAPAPAPVAEPSGGVKIEAPMPGTILDIKVSVGAAVNKGDVVCILEAMKMENDLVAPESGTVASINVNKGDSVEAAQVVMTLN
ncbi:MAG: biotin/lipoyl-binding protein [Clostridiales bacterium]|nr:biotin/lipoyl-binding protein [Clostridiales bacterium]